MKLIVFILILCGSVFAFENEWNLKGGVGLNFQYLLSDVPGGEVESEDELFGLAINTSFGYRFVDFEISTASYVTLGKVKNFYFKVGDEFEATADSKYLAVDFILLLKYYTNINVFKKHQLYFSIGPGIAIQSFWPKNYITTKGTLTGDEKITYETIGVYGTIGMEERALFKEEFPTFLEILWGFNQNYKASLIDVEDSKTINHIASDNSNNNFQNFVLVINFGVTFL